jgi:hypothetical protein
MTERLIEQVQAEYTDVWMRIPGVVGTAIGVHNDKPCILVLTSVDPGQIRSQIPLSVEGHPVVIENTGEIRALGSN